MIRDRHAVACTEEVLRTLMARNSHYSISTTQMLIILWCLVTFTAESRGEVSMVIYEWQDVIYLGKQTSTDEFLPVRCLMFKALKAHCYVVHSIDFVACRRRTYVQATL